MLPSRLISRLILRPGGISRSMRRNCFGAFHVLAVDGDHHVVHLQPDLAGGRVVIDERDDGAAHFLELECLRLVGVHVGHVHAQVARRAGMMHSKWAGFFKDGRKLLTPVRGRCRGAIARPAAAAQTSATPRLTNECHLRYGLKRCFMAVSPRYVFVRSALIKTAQWPEGHQSRDQAKTSPFY